MPPLFNPVRSTSPLMTIAALEAQGFTHLAVRCRAPGCGRSTYVPWNLVRAKRRVPLAALETKFRCKCGAKDVDLWGWASSDVNMAECAVYVAIG